jgi:hypothetical protein
MLAAIVHRRKCREFLKRKKGVGRETSPLILGSNPSDPTKSLFHEIKPI